MSSRPHKYKKQGGIPTTSNNYPLDKNGYAIPILFDAIYFGSNKAIPADSPTASPEDVMNNVLSAFCSNSSDITISQQECANNIDSPEKAISVPCSGTGFLCTCTAGSSFDSTESACANRNSRFSTCNRASQSGQCRDYRQPHCRNWKNPHLPRAHLLVCERLVSPVADW